MKSLAVVQDEVRRDQLWIYTLCTALLLLLSEVYFQVVNSRYGWRMPLQELRLLHSVILLGVIAWLAMSKSTTTVRKCAIAGLLILLPVPPILWLGQEAMLASGGALNPFVGHRLALLVVAILFPAPPRLVMVLVSALALMGIIHVELWRARGVPVSAFHEPWHLLIHWIVACIIVGMRAALGRTQEKYHRAYAALTALEHLTSATRALRDGANTPLQTIETIAFLQRSLDPRLKESAARLERSSAQLKRILGALKLDDIVGWREDDVSFRAEQKLAELQETLIRDSSIKTIAGGSRG